MGKIQSGFKMHFCVLVVLSSLLFTTSSYAERSDVEAFVTRFYQLCLDRSPDPDGLDGWVSGLLNGSLTGSDVAYGFVFSNEFIEKDTMPDAYLRVLYEAFFNRQPDPGGWQTWLNELNSGTDRRHVLNGFIFAVEFAELCDEYGIKAYEDHVTRKQLEAVKDFVTRFYQLCLGRNPDPAGLDTWSDNLLNQVQTGADVANGFMYSKEFLEKNTSNSDFLEVLYEAFFDRIPDPAGWNTWLAELNSGKARRLVLDGFIYSREFMQLCQRFGIVAFKSVPTHPFDGTWVGKGKSAVVSSDCGDAIIRFGIDGSRVSGLAVSAWGDTMPVAGSVDADGSLTAAINIDPNYPVSITGTLSGDSGSGTWSDPGGCHGNWNISRRTGSINMDALKGSYALSGFTIKFNDGRIYTEDDVAGFHGNMTINSAGKMSQDITIEGYQVVAEGNIMVFDDNTLLVASGGCIFESNYTYDGSYLTTILPNGACGSDFSETDVWKKTSSSATLQPSRGLKSSEQSRSESSVAGGLAGYTF